MFIIIDFAPETIKKSTSRSGVCNCLDYGLSKRSGVVHIFFTFVPVVLLICFDKCYLCLSILWVILLLFLLLLFYFLLCCAIWPWSCVIVQKKLIMVLIYVGIYRLFIYNKLIVIFNVFQINWNCVFCVTFAVRGFAVFVIQYDFVVFNTRGSGWISSVDCTWFICLWWLGVLLLLFCDDFW